MTLFSKNHPVLVFLALSGCFLLLPNIHSARAWSIGTTIGDAVKYLLYGTYWFFSLFVNVAAALFVWVIDTKTFSSLMNVDAIYIVWRTVRDFCNIFFILVLLFSAFATIFQLERYEWKKTIPMLVLMALLVNFSFPISRFIIDLANVPMYFFAQNSIGESGNVSSVNESLLGASNIRKIILPGTATGATATDYEFPHLITAVVCMFLYGVSFFVLAILLLIRMIALVILVMFSPIGFAGLITPALHKFASDWWDKLFKWAFYGPISVMLVLVAIVVMKAADTVNKANTMEPLTGDSVSNDFLASVAFLAIPIVLFWIAITQAEKYSNDMSGLGIKWGSQLGRWGARQLRGGSIWTAKLLPKGVDRLSGNRISGTALGIREAWRNRRGWGGKDMKERQERASMLTEGLIGGGLVGRNAAKEGVIRKRAQEMVERNKKFNRTDKDIQEDLAKGGNSEADQIRRRAAALTMAERETFSSSKEFAQAIEAVGGDMDSISKIIRKAPKEIMKNADDLAGALEVAGKATADLSPAAQAQVKNQLIEKASGGALVGNESQIGRILKSFGENDEGKNLRKVFEAKMKKEGKIKSLVDYNISEELGKSVNANASDERKVEIRNQEYEKVLKNYNAENLGSQAGLMDDENFRRFFKQKIQNGDYKARFQSDYMRRAEGDRKAFEEFIRGRRMTEEEEIIAGGGMP